MSNNLKQNYAKLIEKNKESIILGSAIALVNWDMETMMPPRAIGLRSEQLALLSGIAHKMGTNPEIGKLLDAITKSPHYEDLATLEKRNVYLIKKGYEEQTRLPQELVKEIAKQQTLTINAWKKAKAHKNFAEMKMTWKSSLS